MAKRKFVWDIFMDNGYLNINLNGGLNSAIPLTSTGLQSFKEEKKAEIEFYQSIATSKVNGLHLLD
ncbi:hypothetical protein NSQ62_08025 [Solibacillus sp. FSL H8-0523]|uniref:hypothetical protein n=1 Tax=Solibacillus sp. FSL H8-0523 TaxID=2954511 RepID=UPI0031018A60